MAHVTRFQILSIASFKDIDFYDSVVLLVQLAKCIIGHAIAVPVNYLDAVYYNFSLARLGVRALVVHNLRADAVHWINYAQARFTHDPPFSDNDFTREFLSTFASNMWQNDWYCASILEKLNECNLFIIPINYDLKPVAILPAVYSNWT